MTGHFRRASSHQASATATSAGRSTPPSGRTPTARASTNARLAITPTTAAVIAASVASSRGRLRVASTSGPPARMKMNDGRKVK